MTTTASLAERLLAAIGKTAANATHERYCPLSGTWDSGEDFDNPDPTHCECASERVYRHCAAARRIVERHEVYGDGYRKCTSCGERWPCPDLRDIADAYGITTEETT